MAVQKQTIKISADIRVTITGKLDLVTRRLVQAWGRAWGEVQDEWRLAIADIIAQGTGGEWPTQSAIRRVLRASELLEITHAEILKLADLGGVLVTENTTELMQLEDEWQRLLIASQYPRAAGTTAEIATTLNRVDPAALGAIVERTTETITSYRKPLADAATEAMKQSLIRGVAIGDNPNRAAARMLQLVEGRFNGGMARAVNIARTEMLDAHRSGAAVSQLANEDVLNGWLWNAKLDARTCPSCWAQHGTEHPLTEIGPIDHQQGRCDRLPETKSWKDLGFDIEEPPSLIVDSETAFRALPRDEQLKIMGPVRLQALDTGKLTWSELTTRRSNHGWRDSYVPIPVWAARQTLVHSIG